MIMFKFSFNSELVPVSKIRNHRGMTLIEIMIVLGILGGIMAMLLPRIVGQGDKAKVKEAKIMMGQVVEKISMYQNDCGTIPESLENLVTQDSKCSNWGPEPYFKSIPLDPWKNPFEYSKNGGDYTLKSLGRDGQEGGTGYNKDLTLEDLN